MRIFLCAGAPIPGALVEQAKEGLGAKIVSAWGMTENGAVTTTLLDDPDERSINTDGCPLPGMKVRVVGADGAPLPNGVEGRLQSCGCSNFGGYLKRPHLNNTNAEASSAANTKVAPTAAKNTKRCGRRYDRIRL